MRIIYVLYVYYKTNTINLPINLRMRILNLSPIAQILTQEVWGGVERSEFL